jgi:phosphonate dehydrogenase
MNPAGRGRPKVLVTHWVHDDVLERLRAHFEVVSNPDRASWPRDHLARVAADCDAAMMFMPDRVDEAFLLGCPRLRIVAGALKGRDNFDSHACARQGVWLTVVPDLLTAPTAELAVGLAIGLLRHVMAGDEHVRSGRFHGWRPLLYGTGLQGATVGLIGLGAVGQAIARRLAPFGTRLLYADPRPAPGDLAALTGLAPVGLAGLLEQSDVVMPLTHLNPHTRHLIGRDALATMKPGSYLVNVGRGSLVDEKAVADALEARHLAGYAADVFELEDWAIDARPRHVDARLLADRQRTLFTPHLGSAVDRVRRDIALFAAESIIDAFEGRRPRGAVNEPAALAA